MIESIKNYINDIIWLIVITLLEISFISGCLFCLVLLPHGLSWLSLNYFQCYVIICIYRIVTYKMNIMSGNKQEFSNIPMTPSFNNIYPEQDPENTTRPVKNVYTSEEVDRLNHESEFSVRE